MAEITIPRPSLKIGNNVYCGCSGTNPTFDYNGYNNDFEIPVDFYTSLYNLPSVDGHVQLVDFSGNQNELVPPSNYKGKVLTQRFINIPNILSIFGFGCRIGDDFTAWFCLWSGKYPNQVDNSSATFFSWTVDTKPNNFIPPKEDRMCRIYNAGNSLRIRIPEWQDGKILSKYVWLQYDRDNDSTNYKSYLPQGSWKLVKTVPESNIDPVPPPGPFEPGGDSAPGGGGGTFDDSSTPVDIPKPPSISAAQTGLISLFTPTLGQLNSLASFLWSDLFDLATWKKVFSEPMQAILGLSILPVKLPGGAVKEVTLGNVKTGVSMATVTNQYVTVDCGTIDLKEYWKGYLDYSPFTRVDLYLPYIGIHALDTDDVMGKVLKVVYNIDVLTGACTAFVKVGDSVLYSFVGACSVQIPITESNYNSMLQGVISSAAAIGTMALTGGTSAPMLATTAASTAVNSMQKPTVEKSGSMSGSGGIMGIQKPYLIISRPKQAKPKNQNIFTGYPAYSTFKLGDLKGYTEVEEIHLEKIPATAKELSEIEALLKGGVLL